jgi:Carboxypeptidase regulatory-like domain
MTMLPEADADWYALTSRKPPGGCEAFWHTVHFLTMIGAARGDRLMGPSGRRSVSQFDLAWACGRLARALCVLAVFAASLGFVPSALAAEPGQISGTVTNASSAAPLSGVEVCAHEQYRGPGGSSGCASTEPNGEYTITGLKAGEYKVEFSARGRNYLSQFYDGKTASSEAQLVPVAAGQTTQGIDAGLQEGAQITGMVTAASTQEPVDGLEVCAIAVSNGEARCGTTESSGEYDVIGLPTGGYRVQFGKEYTHKFNYVPQFYDGKSSSSEAQTVSVLEGSVTSGIDVQMQEGGRIVGTVSVPGGRLDYSIGAVDVCASTLTGEFSGCGKPDVFSGEYAIEGLASGEYTVGFFSSGLNFLPQYYDGKSSLAEADPVTVTVGQTTPEINAKLSSAGKITGQVTNAATKAPIQGIQVCVEPSAWSNCEWTNANGEYTISELASGEYELGFSPDGLDYFFERKTGIVVTAGQVTSGVDEALTEGGRITGRVTDATTGEPIEGAEACAREVEGDGSQCGTTNANGEYTILRLNGAYAVEFRSRTGGYLAQFYGGEPPFEYGRFVLSPAQQVSVTAPGTVSGIDAALQPGPYAEPVNTAPPIVSGTAAVGSVLSCSPGSWTGDPAPATFTYRWRRDGEPIPGAEESAYTPQSADEGHELSCRVYAMNAAGSQTGTGQALSAGVIVTAGTVNETLPGPPSGPTPTTEATTGLPDSTPLAVTPFVTVTDSKLVISGATAPVSVECDEACQGSIELTVQVPAKNGNGKTAADHKATLVLATGSFSLAKAKNRTVILRLTTIGKHMLAHANRRHPIAAELTLSVNSGRTTTRAVLAV